MNLVLFIIAGLVAIAGAVGVILARQPVHQVLSTILTFIGLAVLYLSLSAEFMAAIQMIVYGGAVMVLFLFVITLLTVRKDPSEPDQGLFTPHRIAGYATGGAILLMLTLVGFVGIKADTLAQIADDFGSVQQFGHELLTVQVLPFELTAFILMVAVIGVVILVGRQKA